MRSQTHLFKRKKKKQLKLIIHKQLQQQQQQTSNKNDRQKIAERKKNCVIFLENYINYIQRKNEKQHNLIIAILQIQIFKYITLDVNYM